MNKLLLLGLLFATPAFAAAPVPVGSFDGSYGGSMTEAAAGVSKNHPYAVCLSQRPAAMRIANGGVNIWYENSIHHTMHYRGQITPDGAVKAYHRNGDGSLSALSGKISGNQFTADIRRGACAYALSLTKD